MYWSLGGSTYNLIGGIVVSAFGLALIIDAFLPEGHRFSYIAAGRSRQPMSRWCAFLSGVGFACFGVSLADPAVDFLKSSSLRRIIIVAAVVFSVVGNFSQGGARRHRSRLHKPGTPPQGDRGREER